MPEGASPFEVTTTDGLKLAGWSYGDEGQPTIMLVHGYPDNSCVWDDVVPLLAAKWRVVTYDVRGCGESDVPAKVSDYRMEQLNADLLTVIDHVSPDEPVHVVGHDWGGLVAWSFAFQHPELLDKLVLVNFPHPRGLTRELANNPRQQENSQYARNFQQPDSQGEQALIQEGQPEPVFKSEYTVRENSKPLKSSLTTLDFTKQSHASLFQKRELLEKAKTLKQVENMVARSHKELNSIQGLTFKPGLNKKTQKLAESFRKKQIVSYFGEGTYSEINDVPFHKSERGRNLGSVHGSKLKRASTDAFDQGSIGKRSLRSENYSADRHLIPGSSSQGSLRKQFDSSNPRHPRLLARDRSLQS